MPNCNPSAPAVWASRVPRLWAAASPRTLAVGPTGMSIRTWVEPAAIFFDSTLATS